MCVGACLQRCLCAYSTPRNLSLSAFVFMFSFSRQGKKNDCKQSAWAKGEQQRRSGGTWSQSRPQRSAASTACLPLPAPSSPLPLASPLQGFVLWLLLRVWPAAACANLSTAANIYTRITPPSTYLPISPSPFPSYLPSSPPSTTPLAGFFIEFVRQQIALDTWRRLLLLLVAERQALRSCSISQSPAASLN